MNLKFLKTYISFRRRSVLNSFVSPDQESCQTLPLRYENKDETGSVISVQSL